jgi:hypothetical protein
MMRNTPFRIWSPSHFRWCLFPNEISVLLVSHVFSLKPFFLFPSCCDLIRSDSGGDDQRMRITKVDERSQRERENGNLIYRRF